MKASPLILSLCAAVLSGCSTPCEGVCSSFNSCTVAERDHKVDCATFCGREQQFEQTAEKAGADTCKKEFDAHITCWQNNIANICDAENTKCEMSAQAWVDCVAKFCAVPANFTNPACVAPDDPDAGATPALSGF